MPEFPPKAPPATAAPRLATGLAPLERNFRAPQTHVGDGIPLGLPAPAPRDAWLRLALFCTLLGAVLTIIYAWVLARQDALAALDPSGLASYHRILVPLLALTAVAGVLILERAAAMGMALILLGTGLGLAGGAVWLLPGTLVACIWAVRHNIAARTTLGFLLLIPGIAGGYYGILGALSQLSHIHIAGLPPGLSAALTLGQAMAPLELLPVALLGAWLLVWRPPAAGARSRM